MAKMVNKEGSEKCRQKEHIPKSDENKISKIKFNYKPFSSDKISSADGTTEEISKNT
jgi:hypothetical protein